MSAAGIVQAVRASVARTMDGVGGEIVDDMKERIGVPVEYRRGYIVRSKPGEPPRRETGEYRAGWAYSVGADASLAVDNDTPLKHWLNKGTRNMAPRPHVIPVFNDWKSIVPQRLAEGIRSDFSP